jgi:hypothetical protein
MSYPNVEEALKEFCAEREVNVTVLMGLHIDGEQIRRDVAVFSSGELRIAHEVWFPDFVHSVQRIQRNSSIIYEFLLLFSGD